MTPQELRLKSTIHYQSADIAKIVHDMALECAFENIEKKIIKASKKRGDFFPAVNPSLEPKNPPEKRQRVLETVAMT